jgi:hypothetical protein
MTGSYMISRPVPTEQWPHLITGQYAVPGVHVSGTTTVTATANRLYLFPNFIPIPLKLTQAAAVITAGVDGSALRLGLFRWNHVDRSVKDLVRDFGVVDSESGDAAIAPMAINTELIVPAGWYAWGLVSSGAITFRVAKGTDPMVGQGTLNANTTNIEAHNYHYATGTGMVGDGITDAAIAAGSVTAVESNSDYTQFFGVFCRFELNPLVK